MSPVSKIQKKGLNRDIQAGLCQDMPELDDNEGVVRIDLAQFADCFPEGVLDRVSRLKRCIYHLHSRREFREVLACTAGVQVFSAILQEWKDDRKEHKKCDSGTIEQIGDDCVQRSEQEQVLSQFPP